MTDSERTATDSDGTATDSDGTAQQSGGDAAATGGALGVSGQVGDSSGFDALYGLRYEMVSAEGVVASLTISEALHQPAGLVHGGVYCAIIESTASTSAYVWLNERGVGGGVVGVNNSTDFLRAITAGTVTATTTPIHRGRRQQLWQVDITDENQRLIAQGRVRLQNIEAAS